MRISHITLPAFRAFISALVLALFAACEPPLPPGDGGALSAPTFNPPGGNVTSTATVTISTRSPGAMIRYSMNERPPTASSPGGALPAYAHSERLHDRANCHHQGHRSEGGF